MAHLLELPNLREGYVELVRYVRKYGTRSKPRGLETAELENVTFTIGDTYNALPIGVGRGINTQVAALEALQLIGGVSTPELLVAAAPHFENFREADGHFHGAYGHRTHGQFDAVIRKLVDDDASRQAIITMWDPVLDNMSGFRDYPCTLGLGFRIRHDRLNMSVTMRSNDVWLGVAYDPFQFTQLQHTICHVLGVVPGSYTHTAWSLHLYEDKYDLVDTLHDPAGSCESVDGVRDPLWAYRLLSHADVLLGSKTLSPSEQWYAERVNEVYGKLSNR